MLFCACSVGWSILKERSQKQQSSTRIMQKTAVCVFFFVWYCFLALRGLMNRAETRTHKAATLLLIMHMNYAYMNNIIYWSMGVVLHVL